MYNETFGMNLSPETLNTLFEKACALTGVSIPENLPPEVLAEFARQVVLHDQSELRTAACVISPPLQLLLAMNAVDGPPSAVEDVRRGCRLLTQALQG